MEDSAGRFDSQDADWAAYGLPNYSKLTGKELSGAALTGGGLFQPRMIKSLVHELGVSAD